MQAVIELIPQGPKDEAHLVPGAVAECVPIHVAAGEVDGAGIILVLLYMVADPLQHLHLGPEVWELTEPLRLVCKGQREGLRGRAAVPRVGCQLQLGTGSSPMVIMRGTAGPVLGGLWD